MTVPVDDIVVEVVNDEPLSDDAIAALAKLLIETAEEDAK